MKTIDITKTQCRVLVVSIYNNGWPYEPAADYVAHNVFAYAPKWATGFPTLIKDGILKDEDGYTHLGTDGASHKLAYIWTK